MNYYVILGIPVDADYESIRHAFRVLARRFHPDTGPWWPFRVQENLEFRDPLFKCGRTAAEPSTWVPWFSSCESKVLPLPGKSRCSFEVAGAAGCAAEPYLPFSNETAVPHVL